MFSATSAAAQADVVDLRGYHDRHRDLVSAGRTSGDADGDGIWGAGGESEALAEEVIEGMPADWLQKRLGEETTRQVREGSCLRPIVHIVSYVVCRLLPSLFVWD